MSKNADLLSSFDLQSLMFLTIALISTLDKVFSSNQALLEENLIQTQY